jgi:hypothetical protein
MAAKIFRINYKSDFILTLESDAGWMTPFCIKFWTGAPMLAYYASWDGETYTHCAPVAGDPTKLQVQFDDHHLPIGDLKYQVAYHFTVADFPNDTEDEVLNQANITTEIDGETYQVMLDFTGETAPEIQFALPAYANEAQRIANEQQRIANETQRIANEETRIQHEESRIAAEQTRQQNEQQRINQEQARVNEYAGLKADAVAATGAANDAAALANQKAQLAADKAALAQAAADLANAKAQLAADKAALADAAAMLANQKAALAQQKAEYAQEQGTYSKNQGDYAKEQGDYSKAKGDYAKDQGDYSKSKGDYAKDQGDYSKQQGDYAKEQGEICAADHLVAVEDHQTATADNQTAAADHQTAIADHNQAGNDHTRAESDHTRAESDHAAVEVYVDSLGAFDISAYHATGGELAKYADLTAALGTNGANIPDALRKGGMSVKFVQSSDNNSIHTYVSYRYLLSSTVNADFVNVDNWQGVDEKPVANSKNLVESGGVYAKNIAMMLKNEGCTISMLSPKNNYYITKDDGNNKKKENYQSALCYCQIDISYIKKNIALTNFTYTPATGASNYTGIFYFDDENNCVGEQHVKTNATDVVLAKPVGATQCYIDIPKAYVDEVTVVIDKEFPVLCTEQSLTEDEKEIARNNIGAVANADYEETIGEIEDNVQDVSDRAGVKRTVTLDSSWKNDGSIVANVGYCRTKDMIPLPAGTTTITWVFGRGVTYSDPKVQILLYNSNKELVENYNPGTNSGSASGGQRRITTIDNSWAYINASFLTNGTAAKPLGVYINDEPYFEVVEESTGAYKDVEDVEDDINELYSRLLMFLKDGMSMPLTGNNSYVTYNAQNKKTVSSNSSLCYFEFPISWFKRSVTVFRVSKLPSTSTPYARLFFFDSQDNLLLMEDFRYVGLKRVALPDNCTQCYFSVTKTWKKCFDFYFDLLSSVHTVKETGITIEEQRNARLNIGVEDGKDAAVYRNLEVASKLYASCNYRKSSNTSKDLQMLIVTDSHGDNVAVQNAKDIANGFVSIDALIHCGDIVNDYYPIGSDHDEQWNDIVDNSSKPCFFVMGNHEKGTYPQIYGTPTDAELYDAFIKKMVDNGWLVSGEYTANKCYWFHDFATLKVRLITLDEYEAPMNLFDETYWRAIAYDSSLANYTVGTTYQAGTKVNVAGYTAYSFEAVQNVTTVYSNNTVPSYKYRRGYRWISQAQAQWFLDTLASTPSGYKVIVACHNPFSINATAQTNLLFCQNGTHSAASDIQTYMTNDFIADAINAFVTKSDFSTTCSSSYPTDMPSYTVSKDFSNVVGTFHSLIGGHSHKDLIWKHNTYNQMQVCPIDANTTSWAASQNSDIRRPNTTNGNVKGVDCLTVASFRANALGLVKVDVNITDDGNRRDYEIVSLND